MLILSKGALLNCCRVNSTKINSEHITGSVQGESSLTVFTQRLIGNVQELPPFILLSSHPNTRVYGNLLRQV